MKIARLKEIIREEVKKALKEKNGTEVADPETETEKKEKTNPNTKPKTPFIKDPSQLPQAPPKATALKAQKEAVTAKDFVDKYNKLKGK